MPIDKCENRGAKSDGYKIRTTESKALFWETAIPEDNGGAGNSELKVYLPDNSLYDDISRHDRLIYKQYSDR